MRCRRELLAGAVLVLAAARARAAPRDSTWPQALTMGTGSTGGTYGVYGAAWGAIAAAATGAHMLYRATEGPNENILLLDRGEIDLAMTTLGIAYDAWTGGGAWTGGARFRTIRAMFPMFESAFHGFVPARSHIRSVGDLGGAIVGIGPRFGTGGTYLPRMLQLLGVQVAEFRFGAMATMADALLAGSVDACLIADGPPVPAFTEAAQRLPIRVFGFTQAEVTRLVRDLPVLSATRISAGTYRGQEAGLACPGMFNFAICRASLPASLVYAVTEAVLAGAPRLAAHLPVAAETTAEYIVLDRFLPLHPGAAEYYRKIGIAVPARLEGG